MRVCRVELNGSRTIGSLEVFEEEIPREIMCANGPEALFDFIAEGIARFAKDVRAIGFTFSFPIHQVQDSAFQRISYSCFVYVIRIR